MNELIVKNINIIFYVGFASTLFVPYVFCVGLTRLFKPPVSNENKINQQYLLWLANINLLISIIIVTKLSIEFFSLGTGSASGLMIPLYMPIPAIFCFIYVVLYRKYINDNRGMPSASGEQF